MCKRLYERRHAESLQVHCVLPCRALLGTIWGRPFFPRSNAFRGEYLCITSSSGACHNFHIESDWGKKKLCVSQIFTVMPQPCALGVLLRVWQHKSVIQLCAWGRTTVHYNFKICKNFLLKDGARCITFLLSGIMFVNVGGPTPPTSPSYFIKVTSDVKTTKSDTFLCKWNLLKHFVFCKPKIWHKLFNKWLLCVKEA